MLKGFLVGIGALTVCLSVVPPLFAQEGSEGSPETEPPAAVSPRYPQLRLLGFGDIEYAAVRDGHGTEGELRLGQLVMHFASRLSPRFTYFAELTFTANAGALDQAGVHGFRAEVERSILRYDFNDLLAVSAGKYHTPINYWNVAFHHGRWLQTTIDRPSIIAFGGIFLPVHFTGALAEGRAPVGASNLQYHVGIGNGRAAILSRSGDAGDVNDEPAWFAGGSINPDRWLNLSVGGAIYRDTISTSTASSDEQILSAFFALSGETPEVIAEYASVRHAAPESTFNHHGYYIQLAHRLSAVPKLKPYVRFERLDIDRADPLFRPLLSERTLLGGLRWDVAEIVALKLEYRDVENSSDSADGLFAQVSFTF